MRKTKLYIRNTVLCALFAALTAIGAFIKISSPLVPITLQTFFVILAGILLGGKLGALSAFCYMATGLAGFPVFTGGGGFSYVLYPTFGYIIGFCAGAYIAGVIAGKKTSPSFWRLFAASLAALALIYASGMAYYYMINRFYLGRNVGLRVLLINLFLVFLPGDITLAALASLIGRRLLPIIKISHKNNA